MSESQNTKGHVYVLGGWLTDVNVAVSLLHLAQKWSQGVCQALFPETSKDYHRHGPLQFFEKTLTGSKTDASISELSTKVVPGNLPGTVFGALLRPAIS